MQTKIAYSITCHFNRFGEEVIDCRKGCGRKTTMLATRLCDQCWEMERHPLPLPQDELAYIGNHFRFHNPNFDNTPMQNQICLVTGTYYPSPSRLMYIVKFSFLDEFFFYASPEELTQASP